MLCFLRPKTKQNKNNDKPQLLFSKTVDLPIEGHLESDDIYYKSKSKPNSGVIKIGACTLEIYPYASLTIGFGLKYKWTNIFKPKLKEISGTLIGLKFI